MELLGIRGTPLSWFSSYLSERKQLVKVSTYTSNTNNIRFGVPQGSILGPSLFIIYMNDIHQHNSNNAEIICYADDTAILYSGYSWENAFSTAETGLLTISKWLRSNLLTLNNDKTNYLCFHKTAASEPSPNSYLKVHTCQNLLSNCSCNQIRRANSIKYLGITLDDKLNFKNHIDILSKRVRKIIGVIKRLRNSASRVIIKYVYTAICQPLLTYCITVWGNAAKSVLITVERAQRSVLKVMFKKPYRYPTDSLYKEAQVLSVRQLFIHKVCLTAHKEITNSNVYPRLLEKRVYKIPTPTIKTTFATRFHPYISTHV